MRISDWSSDVCSSDLRAAGGEEEQRLEAGMGDEMQDGDAGIAGADGDEHEAEVRRGGSRQELFGMILQQRHEAAGDRSRQADRDDSAGKGRGKNGSASCRERVWQYV